jgi:hypothetical protein
MENYNDHDAILFDFEEEGNEADRQPNHRGWSVTQKNWSTFLEKTEGKR